MPSKITSRHLILLTTLASVFCLAYFYMADRGIFATVNFTPIFQFLLTKYDVNTAWVALAVCLLAALWQRSGPILIVVDFLGSSLTTTVGVGVMVLAICSFSVYHNYPLCMDEYAAVFQAKIFAAGRIFAQLPSSVLDWLIVPGFNGVFLVASHETGRAIEGYWPGFALLLAPFEFLGVPWLCNPMLAGVAIYLIYQITFELTSDRRAAGWATLFAIASGCFVAYAISYYSMQAHLTANLLFSFLLLNPTPRRALVAGLVGSLALTLHNPFPHALFAAPWIINLARDPRHQGSFLRLMLGYIPGLCICAGWLILRTHIVPEEDTVSSMGSVGAAFALPGKEMLIMRVASTVKLALWAAPGIFIFAFLGARRYRDSRNINLLSFSALVTFVAYLFVQLDQGHGWGYRYFHSAWGVVPILAGCGIANRSEPMQRLVSFAGAAAILSLALIVPLQMYQIEQFISQHLAQIPSPKRPGNNVVFIRNSGGFYMPDMVQIDPLLRGPDLLLWSRGGQIDAQLIRQNWPKAIRLDDHSWAQEWYLGPIDQRRSSAIGTSGKHFVLTFEPVDSHD